MVKNRNSPHEMNHSSPRCSALPRCSSSPFRSAPLVLLLRLALSFCHALPFATPRLVLRSCLAVLLRLAVQSCLAPLPRLAVRHALSFCRASLFFFALPFATLCPSVLPRRFALQFGLASPLCHALPCCSSSLAVLPCLSVLPRNSALPRLAVLLRSPFATPFCLALPFGLACSSSSPHPMRWLNCSHQPASLRGG